MEFSSFSIYNDGNNVNLIDKSFLNKSLEKIIEKDEDLLYEDRVTTIQINFFNINLI